MIALILALTLLSNTAESVAAPLTIEIKSVDGEPVDGSAKFATTCVIRGQVVHSSTLIRYVQLVASHEGTWRVLPGVAVVGGAGQEGTDWALRISLPPEHDEHSALKWTVRAFLVESPMSIGYIPDDVFQRRVLARSADIVLWRASFAKSTARILRVGDVPALPGVPIAVAQVEPIAFDVSGVPSEALVYVVVRPSDSEKRWPQAHACQPIEGRAVCAATFGRSGPSGGLTEIDTYAKFFVSVVVSTKPLPVSNDGILPPQWRQLSSHIALESSEVMVVRSIPLDGIKVAIQWLGADSDPGRWIVHQIARVTGSFVPGPKYVPRKSEVITLLVRGPDQSTWTIAGWTRLTTSNRSTWTIYTVDFQAVGERRAIAVVSLAPFAEGQAVDERALTESALAVSKELLFRVVDQETTRGRP